MTKASRILVTGGAGFIGSHLVDRLVTEGFVVGVLENFSTGSMENISQHKGLQIHRGDVTDLSFVRETVKSYDTILHQAALVSVVQSVEDPLLTNLVNVGGTLNLLKACLDSDVERFVYASSSSVYGDSGPLPKREDMPPNPISPYGASKLAAEQYCRSFGRTYGLKTICLRYFNVYGPRQGIGPYSAVIPIFTKLVLEGRSPVVYGDGEQSRDFVYVSDVVQANIHALDANPKPGEVFNIATGTPTTINQLASKVLEATGRPDLKPVHAPPRPADIRHSYADISKAKELLKYTPLVDLGDGLRRVAQWMAHRSRP